MSLFDEHDNQHNNNGEHVDDLFAQLETELDKSSERIHAEAVRKTKISVLGIVVGLALCIWGMTVGLWLAVLGFAVMFGASWWGVTQIKLITQIFSGRVAKAVMDLKARND